MAALGQGKCPVGGQQTPEELTWNAASGLLAAAVRVYPHTPTYGPTSTRAYTQTRAENRPDGMCLNVTMVTSGYSDRLLFSFARLLASL